MQVFSRFRIGPQHVVLALLSLILIGLAAASSGWRIDADFAWELYVARMVDQHAMIPYRDIFVIDMPGTILTYTLIGRAIGYTGDVAARLVDAASFAALAGLTWLWLRGLGKTVAWAAIVLFGLVYLEAGNFMSLQREYLLLLPIVASAWLASSAPKLDDRARAALIGLLFGLVATIKPNAAIGLPAVIVFMLLEVRARAGSLSRRRAVALLVLAAAGVLLPVLVMVAYLLASGALPYFADLLARYAPLYSLTTYQLTVVSGPDRLDYLYTTLATLNGRQIWLLPAAAGAMMVYLPGASSDPQRRLAGLMLALAGCYLVYPALTGQFFVYHWLPFVYFLLALAALCLRPLPGTLDRALRVFPLAVLAITLVLRYDLTLDGLAALQSYFVAGKQTPAPESGRSDQIAAFAQAYMAPGETAQPLDWGNGGMLGLLLADVPPGNRFVFDAPFFYDVKGAYVQGLRREFVASLGGPHAPTWLVYVSAQRPVQGPGVDYSWPELQAGVDQRYQLRYLATNTFIYRLADGVPRGVIAYPQPNQKGPAHILDQPDNLLWLNRAQAADTGALPGLLAKLAGRYDLISLDSSSSGPDAGPIRTWLSQNAFIIGQRQLATVLAADYVSRPCAGDPKPSGGAFGDAITVRDTAVGLAAIGGVRYLCTALTWEASKPVGQFYHVALHVFGPDGKLAAQYDGVPMAGLAPTDHWVPGQPVVDRFALALPGDLPAGAYTVSLVVYAPDTGQRLPVAGGDSLTLTTVTLP